jgi:acetyltransferase
VRSVRPGDESRLAAIAASLTHEDLRPRFFTAQQLLSAERLAQLARLDTAQDIALVAEAAKTSELLGVALSRAISDGRSAEFALIVRSDWKGRGVGWMLMQQLVDAVRISGIETLSGAVPCANTNMVQFCRDHGFTFSAHAGDPQSVNAAVTFR